MKAVTAAFASSYVRYIRFYLLVVFQFVNLADTVANRSCDTYKTFRPS